MDNFKQTRLHPDILKAITKMGFETPTPIQAKTTRLMALMSFDNVEQALERDVPDDLLPS